MDPVVSRYKVAFWKTQDSIRSVMVDSLAEAQKIAAQCEKMGFIVTIMELQQAERGAYEWKLLKGGVSPFFEILTQLYRYRLLTGAAILVAYFAGRRTQD